MYLAHSGVLTFFGACSTSSAIYGKVVVCHGEGGGTPLAWAIQIDGISEHTSVNIIIVRTHARTHEHTIASLQGASIDPHLAQKRFFLWFLVLYIVIFINDGRLLSYRVGKGGTPEVHRAFEACRDTCSGDDTCSLSFESEGR